MKTTNRLVLGALGIGALFFLLNDSSDEPESPTEPTDKPKPAPTPTPKPQKPAQPVDPLPKSTTESAKRESGDEDGPLYFSYTTSSILLESSTDKYNEGDIVKRVKEARARQANSEGNQLVKKIWQAEVAIINAVAPGAGTAIFTAFNLLVSAVNEIFPKSGGGFEKLPARTRQRLLFFLAGGKRALGSFTVEGVKPQAPADDSEAAWRSYYKQVLLLYRGTVEWWRIIYTDDDVVPPAVICNFLIEQKLWPLPFEPVPPSSSQILSQYSGQSAVARVLAEIPLEPLLYPERAKLPRNAEELAGAVFLESWQEWSKSMETTRKVFNLCRTPSELATLLETSGSIPRHGSYLFAREGNAF